MEKSGHISTNAKRSSKLLAALILAAILVLSIVFITIQLQKVGPTTKDVYPGQSIQAVLDSASLGDTIIVHEGEYHQSVVVTKSISLIGDKAILNGTSPADPGTTLTFDAITIDEGVSDVTIKGFEIMDYSYYGIQAWNNGTSNIEIINNVIHDMGGTAISVGNDGTGFHENWFIHNNTIYRNEIGIYVAHGKNVVISNNIADESFWSGIWVGIEPDSTFNSEHIEVINNTVTNAEYGAGIYVLSSSEEAELKDITITGNTVSDCSTDGIVVLKLSEECRNSRDVFISDNRVDNNGGAGILLEGVSYGKVLENEVTNSRDGIIVFDSNHIIVKRNMVTDNFVDGIEINSADNNKVIDNIVKDNRWGIVLVDGSSYNIVMFNEAKGNIAYDLSDDKTGTNNIWEFNIYDTKDW
ncbi:MAG: right-handed parallel beta-helix repeat-containing protein [archaeon]|nr:right-handed parallel beta-helix repeat-containing protein [archaeon]MCP8316203.1 right-handed parallel beta-helix repeat-containing protein [archaeon]MCP8320948.1 right-handed parallel beta-helix repeat-containing protein [archaeon]